MLKNYTENITNNISIGKLFGDELYKSLKNNFCKIKLRRLLNIALPIVNSYFKNPVRINEIAKEESFDKEDYINVLKYIFNINKFIKEIYENKAIEELYF